jgi:hypothetical protein
MWGVGVVCYGELGMSHCWVAGFCNQRLCVFWSCSVAVTLRLSGFATCLHVAVLTLHAMC